MDTTSPKESRKRSADSSPMLAPPKKQFLGMNESSNGEQPSNPLELGLLQYQNRHIKIRIAEKNTEIGQLKSDIKDLENKNSKLEVSLGAIEKAWKQLLENLKLQAVKLQPITNIGDVVPNFKETPPTSLLDLLFKNDDGDKQVEAIVNKRSAETKSALERIIESVEKEKSVSQALASALREGAADKGLKEDNEKLRQQNAELKANLDELHGKYKQVFDSVNRVTQEKAKLEDKIDTFEDKLDRMKNEMETSVRKANKWEIKYEEDVANFKYQLFETKKLAEKAADMKVESAVPIKQEERQEDAKEAVNSEEMAELRRLADIRNETIEKLNEERINFIKEIQQLKRDIQVIPEDKILKSRPYLMLQDRADGLERELSREKDLYDKCLREVENLVNSYNKEREKSTTEEKSRRDELTRALTDAETRAKQFKLERDELTKKLESIKVQTNQQIVQEFNKIASQKDAEIKKLSGQINGLKDEVSKLKQYKEDHKKGNEKIYETLDAKLAEIKELQNVVQDREKNLEDLKIKRKRWEEKEKIVMAQLDSLKSTMSPEQREMKELIASERRLKEENSKLQSDIERLEKNMRIKEIESKHDDDVVNVKKEYGAKIVKLERIMKEMKTTLDSVRSERDGLMGEIEAIAKTFEESQEQNVKLLAQLADKEDTMAKLMADQIRASQGENTLRFEKENAVNYGKQMEERVTTSEEVMKRTEAKCRLMQDQNKRKEEEMKALQNLIDGLKRSAFQNSLVTADLKNQVNQLEKDLQEEKKRADEKEVLYHKEQNKLIKFDEQNNLLNKRIQRFQAMGMKDSDPEGLTEEQLRIYKHKLNCSVCNDQPKSVVIARCFHMFCGGCIEKNLAMRHRKCPACGKPFADSDVHNIYFS